MLRDAVDGVDQKGNGHIQWTLSIVWSNKRKVTRIVLRNVDQQLRGVRLNVIVILLRVNHSD